MLLGPVGDETPTPNHRARRAQPLQAVLMAVNISNVQVGYEAMDAHETLPSS